MTCIAGAIKDGEVCIGGDAVSVHGDSAARVSLHGKVFRVGEFVIGSSGTLRVQQVFRYLFQPPPIQKDLHAYMVKDFVPVLRELMKENGCECKTEEDTYEMDDRYLIAVRGCLFEMDSGYGVLESRASYAAVGSADQEALAGMFTAVSLSNDLSAEEIVRRGLLAAAEFDTNIRPPFTFKTLTESDWHSSELVNHKPNGEWGAIVG